MIPVLWASSNQFSSMNDLLAVPDERRDMAGLNGVIAGH